MLGSKPDLSWNRPSPDFVTPAITPACLQGSSWQEAEFSPHLFSQFPSGRLASKSLAMTVSESPRVILSADGDPEGRDFHRSHGWGEGKDGAGGEPVLPPTFQPCPLVLCLPLSRVCPYSPSLGLATPVEGEMLPGASAPGGRTHSRDGVWGTAPGTRLHVVISSPQTAGRPCICQVRSLPGCCQPLQISYLYEMKRLPFIY